MTRILHLTRSGFISRHGTAPAGCHGIGAPGRRGHRSRSIAGVMALALAALIACSMPAASQTPIGSIAVLQWPAPGDDGSSGRAARYEVRYRTTPLFNADTLGYWTAGTVVSGAPQPGPAGSVDSLVVTGLNPSVAYYFIVRAADEVPNWSGFSNIVVKPAFPDQIRPAVVSDLEAALGNAAKSPPRDTEDEPPPPPPRR